MKLLRKDKTIILTKCTIWDGWLPDPCYCYNTNIPFYCTKYQDYWRGWVNEEDELIIPSFKSSLINYLETYKIPYNIINNTIIISKNYYIIL